MPPEPKIEPAMQKQKPVHEVPQRQIKDLPIDAVVQGKGLPRQLIVGKRQDDGYIIVGQGEDDPTNYFYHPKTPVRKNVEGHYDILDFDIEELKKQP